MESDPTQMPSEEELRQEYSRRTKINVNRRIGDYTRHRERNLVPAEFGDATLPAILALTSWALWGSASGIGCFGFCGLGIFAFCCSYWTCVKLWQAIGFNELKKEKRRRHRWNVEQERKKALLEKRDFEHDKWALPVVKSLEDDARWQEAVSLLYTHLEDQDLSEDQIYDRLRELLPQLVVNGPEHWAQREIVVHPQLFSDPKDRFSVDIFLEGYGPDVFDVREIWDSGPEGPYSIDEAIDVKRNFEFFKKDIESNASWKSELDKPLRVNLFESVKPTKKRSRTIPRSVQDRVWRRDGGKCTECGSNENLEFDHIIPFSKGGANTYRNLQLLCQNCNRLKSDKIGG